MNFRNAIVTVSFASILIGSMSSLASAHDIAVYMKEDASGKQIWMKNFADGSEAPVTSGQDWHLYPEISADGTKLVYVEGPDAKNLAVVMRDLMTGQITKLTANGAYLHPNLSGDGKHLAFSGPLGPHGAERIGVLDLTLNSSAGQALVVQSTEKSYFPSLSSDGSFVVFQRSKADGTKDIVEVQLTTGETRQITAVSGKSMSPDLSFDDRYITYTSQRAGNWDVYVYDRFTGVETRLTTDPGDDFAPSFDRKGDVFFASSRTGHFALYKISSWNTGESAGEKLVISAANADLYAPSLSGDLSWKQSTLAPMLAPARSSFGAVEHQGRIYVVGGHQGPEHTYPPESFVGNLEYYDVQTGTWHRAASRNIPSHGFDIVAHGDYIYAFGGFAYSTQHQPRWHSLDVIERYNIKTDVWEVIGHMPRPRSSNVVAQVGNKVWLIGGWDSTPQSNGDREGRFHREVDVFDLETETASTTPYLLPDPLRRAFTGVVRDGKIVLLGGLGVGASHFGLLDAVTEFDPATGKWTELPRLPFATFAPAAGVLGNEIYIFGGMFKRGPSAYDYVNHFFSFTDEAWVHTGRYMRETKGFSMVVNLGGERLGILGGHSYENATDAPVSTFEVFEHTH